MRALRVNQLIYFNINLSMETQIRLKFQSIFRQIGIISQRQGLNYRKYQKLIKKLSLVTGRALRHNNVET